MFSCGGRPVRPDAVDLRWVGAMLFKNGVIEETGLAAAVLNHPAHGVAWLANMDDLIAAGPMGQQVARLRNLSPRDRAIWGWVLIGGVPAACLLLSILVYLARRT